jgi:hypothetical protein
MFSGDKGTNQRVAKLSLDRNRIAGDNAENETGSRCGDGKTYLRVSGFEVIF